MALGRYVTDLEPGDILGPIEYTVSPFVVRHYCHAVELSHEFFQGIDNQIVPPTLVHLEKLRLYRHACPQGTGPTARVHVEYDATFHDTVRAGERLRVRGEVTERVMKRGREYTCMNIELFRVVDNKLLVTYRDTVLLAYKPQQTEKGA